MNKIKFSIQALLLVSTLIAGLTRPENGSSLNYIHVLFEWDQEPDAIFYNLQVSENSTFYFDNLLLNIDIEIPLYSNVDAKPFIKYIYSRNDARI